MSIDDEVEPEFTDFHVCVPGKLDLRVFDQDKWWVDRNGTPHLIAEMSDDYKANVLLWLLEMRGPLFEAIVRRRLIEVALEIPVTAVAGSVTTLPPSADEWLRGTSLFRWLAERSKLG